QAELADLLNRDVHVFLAGQERRDPQEAVALVPQVEQAGHLDRFALEVVAGGLVRTGRPRPLAWAVPVAAPAAAPAVGLVVLLGAGAVATPALAPTVGAVGALVVTAILARLAGLAGPGVGRGRGGAVPTVGPVGPTGPLRALGL